MKPNEEMDAARLAEAFREAARARALELGFTAVGFTTAEPLGANVERRWRRWRQADRAGKMRYLMRPEPRRTHPRDLMPEARTVVVVAASYWQGNHPAAPIEPGTEADREAGPEHRRIRSSGRGGKVARYAWGEDYHLVIRERLSRLAEWMAEVAPEYGVGERLIWRAVSDSAPLDDRALAVRAGLGFIGKNTLLLHPKYGSWTLLGELLISANLPPDEPLTGGTCGSCRRCIDACPTGALQAPWELEPRQCLSYLTIEQRDEIPEELAERMEGWAFGCDICQEVCPFNERPAPLAFPEFRPERGVGPYLDERAWEGVPSKKAFTRRWRRSAVTRPGLDALKRNVAAARRSRKIKV